MKSLRSHLVKVVLIGVVVCSQSSFSEKRVSLLKPLPNSPADLVENFDKNQLPCSEVSAALEEYNELARANEIAFADFILEVTGVMYDWHRELQPLEGESGVIRQGMFDPIYQGAEQVDEIVGMIYENSDQLAARMDVIINSLKNCL